MVGHRAESLVTRVVYLVWHSHVVPGSDPDEKLLGVYSTEERARSRVEQARFRPGFRDLPDGFEVVESELDKDEWAEGYRTADGVDVPSWLAERWGDQRPGPSGTSR
jgi:hypothetical protein